MLSSASGASVTKISSAPSSGPATIASTAPTPTIEATRSQRPRTSAVLRRRLAAPGDPRARPPVRAAASSRRARSRRERGSPSRRAGPRCATPDSEPAEQRAEPPERKPVGRGPIVRPSSISTRAQTVAACTSASPSSVSVVPIADHQEDEPRRPTRPSCRRPRARTRRAGAPAGRR